jgi:hypothetical protein
MKRAFVIGLAAILLAAGPAGYAQRRNGLGGFRGFFAGGYDNDPPPTEFIMARWRPASSRGWEHDYPSAEEHILQVMTETSIIDVEILSYKVVEMSSPEIFDYPFAYLSHPGDMYLTDQEVEQMREYVERGGFIMMDDFGGQDSRNEAREYNTFIDNMKRVFPDLEPFELAIDHPIFHNFYDIESINLVHPMNPAARSVFLGYPDGNGGISMIICFRNDVGDFWEFIDVLYYPVEPSAEALKLGLNFVHWAFTH